MQSSSTNTSISDVLRVVDAYLSSDDLDDVDALESLIPVVRRLQFRVTALGSRGVELDAHNIAGARSGAAWFGSLLGIGEKSAALQLGDYRSMVSNPDVFDLAESGSLSFAKAALISRGAKGSESITQQLIPHLGDSF